MADRSDSIAPVYFSRIAVILVEPQVPGNIGAVARAMTTMGLSRLILVNPGEVRKEAEARWMAHGAGDVLESAQVVSTLDETLTDLAVVVGTTNRTRGAWLHPIQPIDEALAEMGNIAQTQRVGILFGREDRGLSNVDLQRCNVIARIPAATTYPSLNLSHSVTICAFELFRRACESVPSEIHLATNSDVERVCQRIHGALLHLGFSPRPNEETFLRSIRRVLRRSLRLEQRDIATLHKVCDEIEAYANGTGAGK